MEGLIIKGIGGFYYVKTEMGVIQTRGRGKFRKSKITPHVGDQVEITILEDGDGVVDNILPRSNIFVRPPISNVDTMIIVFAAKNPEPNFEVINKFLVMAEAKGIEAMLCMNKSDLVSEDEARRIIEPYKNVYKTFVISALAGDDIENLRNEISDKVVALAGPSGVGKSSILNKLIPGIDVETSEISTKSKRGRHTTRHVELFELGNGGMIFDTPGFTSLEMQDIDADELDKYFPEFTSYLGQCKFDNCRHQNEPDCKVKEAVALGNIDNERYNSYIRILNELVEKNRRTYG